MAAAPQKRSNILQFALIFALVYLASQFLLRTFFPEKFGGESPAETITLRAVDPTVKDGHHPELTLENGTAEDLKLPDRCPMPPLEVYRVEGLPEEGEQFTPLKTTETVLPCTPLTVVPAGERVTVSLAPWKYSLFEAFGAYEVRLPLEGLQEVDAAGTSLGSGPDAGTGAVRVLSTRFRIHEAGFVTKVFRAFITKPFLNFLILVASFLPDRNLGVAIIVLTLCVKLLLYYPTQKAMEGQRELQKVQPKLAALKEKYKDDQERLNREMLSLWKEHKVNPFQSCLPTLIQFPVLIGLFYTVRDGSILALSSHLIYEPYRHLSWTFGTGFLGLDLLEPSIFLMPPLLVALQFFQMKLAFAVAKRKQEATGGKREPQSAEKMQQNMMLYGLPLFIGFFAIQFPAAVSLYWGVSTIFAIGQQIVVNRRT